MRAARCQELQKSDRKMLPGLALALLAHCVFLTGAASVNTNNAQLNNRLITEKLTDPERRFPVNGEEGLSCLGDPFAIAICSVCQTAGVSSVRDCCVGDSTFETCINVARAMMMSHSEGAEAEDPSDDGELSKRNGRRFNFNRAWYRGKRGYNYNRAWFRG